MVSSHVDKSSRRDQLVAVEERALRFHELSGGDAPMRCPPACRTRMHGAGGIQDFFDPRRTNMKSEIYLGDTIVAIRMIADLVWCMKKKPGITTQTKQHITLEEDCPLSHDLTILLTYQFYTLATFVTL
jgi:hypothetical protein